MLVLDKYDAGVTYVSEFSFLQCVFWYFFLLKTMLSSIHIASGSLCRVPKVREIGNLVAKAAPMLGLWPPMSSKDAANGDRGHYPRASPA